MAYNVVAGHLDISEPEGSVIRLDTKETQVYSNILATINRPSISRLDQNSVELVQDLMQVTYACSKYPVSDTSKKIVGAVMNWERWQAAIDEGIDIKTFVYNAFVARSTVKRDDSSHKELTVALLHRMIPFSYAAWAGACLAATSVFWTMFAYGLALGSFVIGPWLNLMLCVASTGLLATVVTAIIDWRRKHCGQRPGK